MAFRLSPREARTKHGSPIPTFRDAFASCNHAKQARFQRQWYEVTGSFGTGRHEKLYKRTIGEELAVKKIH